MPTKNFKKIETAIQDGSIGEQGSPPHTTTSKLQLHYRTTVVQDH